MVTLDLGLPPDPDGTSEGFATLEEILRAEARHQGDRRLRPRRAAKARSGRSRMGAYDFYQKPVDIDELGLIVARAFHLHAHRGREPAGSTPRGGATVLGSMITAAPEMLKVARTIERVANADVSVMLLGASGTGKELLARAVHEQQRPQGRVRRDQLRRDPRKPARGGIVRLRARRVHRRGQVQRRQDRAGRGRHPVPRRGRRHPAAAPGQAAALPPGAGDRADRRAQARSRSTRGSSAPPTRICRR